MIRSIDSIWEHQSYFRIGLKCVADLVFKSLDSRLKPEVFLVGISADRALMHLSIHLEAENDFWAASSDFENVHEVALGLEKRFPKTTLDQTDAQAELRHQKWAKKKSLQGAVRAIANGHHAHTIEKTYWVSLPVKVGQSWVLAAIGLQNEIVESYASLPPASAALELFCNSVVSKSLLEASIIELLALAESQLAGESPGSGFLAVSHDEILRSAGARLMASVETRVNTSFVGRSQELFRSINEISALSYEGSAGYGTLILANKKHPNVRSIATFKSSVRLANFRGSRKLLELSSSNLHLHSDGVEVLGLATLEGLGKKREDIFLVKMSGHYYWELIHAGNVLMRVSSGHPSLPQKPFSESKLRLDLKRIFRKITADEISDLVGLVKQAGTEARGTILIISENAEAEARRLESQGIPLVPCRLTRELLKHLTPIDGALIISPDGICQ